MHFSFSLNFLVQIYFLCLEAFHPLQKLKSGLGTHFLFLIGRIAYSALDRTYRKIIKMISIGENEISCQYHASCCGDMIAQYNVTKQYLLQKSKSLVLFMLYKCHFV